ncbi:MAG: tRNA 2-thiouridine(34) synthase MnmA [Planctomycetes bacterium]|nr:tRNA 2-thiouridine(34) synthase MnmA [Planctomycetota bacterium]
MATAVLISGGVDSSLALRLLREEGCRDLAAFYLKIWLEDELAYLGSCPWEEDLCFARQVCDAAGVPLRVVSLQREYHERVVSYTLAELEAGRTPSPDIFCNQRVKFGAFLEAAGPSFERVATGHYARVERSPAGGRFRVRLLKGIDPVKDQTYFLSHLSREQLARCAFPVGGLLKQRVRELAAELGLPNAGRPDSQGICFLGKVPFDDFVRHHLGERKGEIVEAETGRRLGEHGGYWFFTIGQRRGLGLGQGPWFVVGKDVERNIVYVSHQERLEEHSRDAFEVADAHWIAEPPGEGRLEVKLRHSPRAYRCTLRQTAGGRYAVRLDGRDPGVAPGQFAVFYEGDACLGGARIV